MSIQSNLFVSWPILPCLILTFEKRKHNFLLFVEGWAVGARDFESKIFTVFRMYCSGQLDQCE